MRNKLLILLGFAFTLSLSTAIAQTSGEYFNRAARSYVKTEKDQALATVKDGLTKFPSDAKLQALKEKLEKEQEEQDKQDQQKQDQQNQEEKQQQEDQKSQGEDGEQQESKEDGDKTNEDKAKESQAGDPSDKSDDKPSENANDQMDAA